MSGGPVLDWSPAVESRPVEDLAAIAQALEHCESLRELCDAAAVVPTGESRAKKGEEFENRLVELLEGPGGARVLRELVDLLAGSLAHLDVREAELTPVPGSNRALDLELVLHGPGTDEVRLCVNIKRRLENPDRWDDAVSVAGLVKMAMGYAPDDNSRIASDQLIGDLAVGRWQCAPWADYLIYEVLGTTEEGGIEGVRCQGLLTASRDGQTLELQVNTKRDTVMYRWADSSLRGDVGPALALALLPPTNEHVLRRHMISYHVSRGTPIEVAAAAVMGSPVPALPEAA